MVEDEPDIAALVAYQLTRAGYRVETTRDGAEALRAVGREVPDLVVLDRMLPGISGDDVLARLRDNAGTTSIPVLLLTARREEEDRITGLELGRTTISPSRSALESWCCGCRRFFVGRRRAPTDDESSLSAL